MAPMYIRTMNQSPTTTKTTTETTANTTNKTTFDEPNSTWKDWLVTGGLDWLLTGKTQTGNLVNKRRRASRQEKLLTRSNLIDKAARTIQRCFRSFNAKTDFEEPVRSVAIIETKHQLETPEFPLVRQVSSFVNSY